MEKYYIKCASNEQAQALRPHLVSVGLLDDIERNELDSAKRSDFDCIKIYTDGYAVLRTHDVACFDATHLYTVPYDADVLEAAKTIKDLLVKRNLAPNDKRSVATEGDSRN